MVCRAVNQGSVRVWSCWKRPIVTMQFFFSPYVLFLTCSCLYNSRLLNLCARTHIVGVTVITCACEIIFPKLHLQLMTYVIHNVHCIYCLSGLDVPNGLWVEVYIYLSCCPHFSTFMPQVHFQGFYHVYWEALQWNIMKVQVHQVSLKMQNIDLVHLTVGLHNIILTQNNWHCNIFCFCDIKKIQEISPDADTCSLLFMYRHSEFS